jgi:hypothetical protein
MLMVQGFSIPNTLAITLLPIEGYFTAIAFLSLIEIQVEPKAHPPPGCIFQPVDCLDPRKWRV